MVIQLIYPSIKIALLQLSSMAQLENKIFIKNHIQKSNAEIHKKPKTRQIQVGDTVLVKQDMTYKSMA